MATATDRGAAAGPALLGMAALSVVAGVIRASRPLLTGTDPFWHYDLGRRIVSDGLPRTDPYSFLREGQEWILNQWGSEAIFGIVDAVAGLRGLAVFAAVLAMAALVAVGWQMWRRAPSLFTMLLFGAVVLTCSSNLALRGNLFTFLVLPLVLGELLREDGPRPVVIVPLLVVWANLHAAFLFGVTLVLVHVGAAWIRRDSSDAHWVSKRGVLVVIGALTAGVFTPYGPRFMISALELATRAGGAGISEWAPASPTRPDVLPYTLLVALVLVSLGLAGRSDDLPQVLMTVAAALLGFSAIRNLAAASIVVGIVGAPYVHRAWLDLRRREFVVPRPTGRVDRALAGTLLIAGTLGVVVVVPGTNELDAHVSDIPLELIRGLDAQPGEHRVVTTSTWAGAVAALTGDHVKTAVDARLELFSDEELQSARELESANPGWEAILDAWCVTDVIVPANLPLATVLLSTDPWQLKARTQANVARVGSMRYSRSRPDCPHSRSD